MSASCFAKNCASYYDIPFFFDEPSPKWGDFIEINKLINNYNNCKDKIKIVLQLLELVFARLAAKKQIVHLFTHTKKKKT